jgi:hypothetical protein
MVMLGDGASRRPGAQVADLVRPSSKVGATSRATLRACSVTVALAVGARRTLADAAGREADIATTMNHD